jgi:Tetratricopeptide repeat
MATTEIEKLERRYAENPQGLTFAPLAEVHRKNGDVARALELLKAGLELHPNYIPASIVLGRCHWDLGDLPAAESAFAHVLRLDDENVIALKSLADINEKLERFTEAQRWLNRLISIDRSNEEARQQLARVEAARQPAPASPMPQETSAAEPAPARSEAPLSPPQPKQEEPPAPVPLSLTAELEQSLAVADSESAGAVKSGSPALEFIDTAESAAPPEKPSQAPPLADESAKLPAGEPAPLEGLISQEFVPPRDSYRSHPELTTEFVEPTDSNEPGLDGLEVETAEEVELQSSGASEFRVPNAAEDFMEAAFAAGPSRPPDIPAAPRAAPEPPPPPLPVTPSPSTDLELNIPAPTPLPGRSYSARETRGQSVAAFFTALLGARPAGATNAQPRGTHPADTGAPAAAHPASPAEGPSPAAAGPSGDAAVSFDDLFGTPAEPSPTPKGSTNPGKEDLDQFQSWLQNLKR